MSGSAGFQDPATTVARPADLAARLPPVAVRGGDVVGDDRDHPRPRGHDPVGGRAQRLLLHRRVAADLAGRHPDHRPRHRGQPAVGAGGAVADDPGRPAAARRARRTSRSTAGRARRTARGSGPGPRRSSSTRTAGATSSTSWSCCRSGSSSSSWRSAFWLTGVRAARGAAGRPDHPVGRVAGAGRPRAGVRARRPPVRVPVGLLLVPTAAVVSRGLMVLHRAVVQGLLCVDPTAALRQDVERLRGSRSAALELEASELRRIERDLHDGAQQRLVSLAIDLGRAEERIDTDPAAAKAIVADARAQARLALAELRDLVRGTMPAILVDRGLEAALAAVAAGCPVPTTVISTLAAGRAAPAGRRAGRVLRGRRGPRERGQAQPGDALRGRGPPRSLGRSSSRCATTASAARAPAPGGGLAGLRDRAQALDGTLALTSPAGGPTVVRVVLPLAAGEAGQAPGVLGAGRRPRRRGRRAPRAPGDGRSRCRAGRACRGCW